MSESGHYPPPDFSSPPPNTFQQQPRTSSFHPGMWSWQETPEASPGYSSYGYPSAWGNYGTNVPHGHSYGHQWHQGGGRGGRPHYGTPGNYGHKKNKKEPECPYFCDTCDRGFKNAEKYNEHISQHVKCSVPDCTFMAHEKIVSIHWKNNHAPGAKRIKLDTPEEIAKWREERRKNYPTRDNVEKKKKMMEMREETGGVLETAQFGRMRGRGRGRGGGRGRGRGNRGSQGRYQQPFHMSDGNVAEKLLVQTPAKRDLDGDPLGTSVCADLDSDKDDAAPEKVVVTPKQITSGLGSLMANYGSMSESEEEPDSTPIQKAHELIQKNQTILNMATNSQDTVPVTFNAERNYNRRGRRGRGGRRGKGRHQDTPQKSSPTLLEMLLAPDMRHERNVLLQCVRYVVRNNFFGLEKKLQEKDKKLSSVTNGKHSHSGGSHVQTDVDQCTSQKSITADSAQKQDSLNQSTSLPVVNCQVKSFSINAVKVSQNTSTSPTIDCRDQKRSIYDDEIWE
ncbi:FMR1-interacting protein NUFIP1 [Eucyclogobius newberryi]|uniref:FMR1-interacting protein NUFIP1 n=1 Tax=Eucyclogobius newberryi TaxID=166745 RepID=UPI003B5BF3AD